MFFRRLRLNLIPPNSLRSRVARQLLNYIVWPLVKVFKKQNTESDLTLIKASDQFDAAWYLAHNPDVANARVDPVSHYLRHGGFEGRDPGPNFSSQGYLDTYKDVKQAGINPLLHYLRNGKQEGRTIQPQRIVEKKYIDISKHHIKRRCDFFFIVGTGRSGTTLMAQVMNAHSKICVPSELQIVFETSNNGERLAEIFASQKNLEFQAEDYIKLIEQRCPHNLSDYYDYRSFFQQLEYPITSLQWLLTELYTDIAYSQGKSIFAEQTPWYGQNIKLLNQLFPQAKFIHMLRDGRDVAISFARTPWWHKDVNLNLERWAREVGKIEEDGLLLLKERLLTVRYEDLILTPEKMIERVCDFLDVPFEKAILDVEHHIDYSQFSRPAHSGISSSAYQKWQKGKRSAFFSDSVYGWKTNQEVHFDTIGEPIMELLKRFGYED